MDFEEDLNAVKETEQPDGLAMELLRELKEQNKIAEKHNLRLFIIIIILIVFLVGLSAYHEYQWSQFDTISVDTKTGGNASYIGGNGDVNNYGEDSSTQAKEQQ
jgi:hypothetical protein